MGSSSRSTETGVTRLIPSSLPEAVNFAVTGTQVLTRTGTCPSQFELDLLVPQAAQVSQGNTAELQISDSSGVVVVFDGRRIPIRGELSKELQKCMEAGLHYVGEVKKQEVKGDGLQVTILFVAA